MSLIVFLALHTVPIPSINAGLTTHVYRTEARAKVRIVEAEKIGPVDRTKLHKVRDRIVRRRGDIILVEFF